MASPSGLRSPDDTPRPPGGAPGPGPATLAGMQTGQPDPDDAATPEGGGPGGGMRTMLGQAIQQVEQTEMMLQDLSRQLPAALLPFRKAVESLRQAGAALRAAEEQIVTNPGQPEPPAPAIGG